MYVHRQMSRLASLRGQRICLGFSKNFFTIRERNIFKCISLFDVQSFSYHSSICSCDDAEISSTNDSHKSSDLNMNNEAMLDSVNISVHNNKISIFEYVQNLDILSVEIENIRNFSIIAHIDHGKSTLADSMLQLAGNITEKDRKRGQVLDQLKVERERGITVKAQTATMIFRDDRDDKKYLINLIDTPGHIDFSYEVSFSLKVKILAK